jgi:hypothetical protein
LHPSRVDNIFIQANVKTTVCERKTPIQTFRKLKIQNMTRKTFTPVGALHPILFFAGVYAVVLVFSIFICSSIFYSCNTTQTDITVEKQQQAQPATNQYTSGVASLK